MKENEKIVKLLDDTAARYEAIGDGTSLIMAVAYGETRLGTRVEGPTCELLAIITDILCSFAEKEEDKLMAFSRMCWLVQSSGMRHIIDQTYASPEDRDSAAEAMQEMLRRMIEEDGGKDK